MASSKEGGGLLASIGLKKEDIKVNEDDSIADDESLGDLHKKSDLFDKSKDKKEDGLKKRNAFDDDDEDDDFDIEADQLKRSK